MATISLYASKVNNMPSLVKDLKSSVSDLKSDIFSIKCKSLGVSKSVCDLDDVISTISASTKTQEEKIASLAAFEEEAEEFIAETERIDEEVAELVDKQKDDFYDKYYYLKPECEKTNWEKFCDGCKKVGQWCKENWKSIAKIVAAVVIIVALGIASVLTGGALAVILAGAFWGALIAGVMGGIIGGITSAMGGGSFLEGFADGLLSGTVSGAISGAACAALGVVGQAVGKGIQCMSKLGQAIKLTSKVTQVISLGMDGFDLLAMGIGLFDPDNAIVKLNTKLHSSKLYNIAQITINGLAIFTGAATSSMKCFVAGTMVLTAAGHVAIECIHAGDRVISTDPDTMERAEKTVLETYVRESSDVIHLTIGGEVITATHDHPFYVQDVGFVSAGSLYVGDKLIGADGKIQPVEDLRKETLAEPVAVYNFKVETFHTYHIGEASVFVHNADYPSHMNPDGSLKPNTEYTAGEYDYKYKTNEDGYIEYAHADELHFKQHDGRLKHNPNTPGKIKGQDHAGHLFADQFGGSPELDNLVSQLGDLNGSGGSYYNMEKSWTEVMKNGGSVKNVDIKVNYEPGASRPSSFEVSYTVTNKRGRTTTFSDFFSNTT